MKNKMAEMKITVNYDVKSKTKIQTRKFTVTVSKWIKLNPEEQTQYVAKKCRQAKLLSWSI